MPFLVTLLILVARQLVPLVGSIALMGLIAALMEYLLTGMVLHAAGGAILLEALGAELILTVGGMRLLPILLVGAYVELYTAYHPLLFSGKFCQSMHVMLYRKWVLDLLPWIQGPLTRSQTWWLVNLSHLGIGLLAGGLYTFLRSRVPEPREW